MKPVSDRGTVPQSKRRTGIFWRYFLACCVGALFAVSSTWWLWPRPEFVVALPEVEGQPWYAFVTNTRESTRTLGLDGYIPPAVYPHFARWQLISGELGDYYFLDQKAEALIGPWHTGYNSRDSEFRFDVSGRAIMSSCGLVETYDESTDTTKVEYYLEVNWFDPATQKSGTIAAPPFPGEGPYEAVLGHEVSADGSTLFCARANESGELEINVFDLVTETVRTKLHFPEHTYNAPEGEEVRIWFEVSADGSEIILPSKIAEYEVFSAVTGNLKRRHSEKNVALSDSVLESQMLDHSQEYSYLADAVSADGKYVVWRKSHKMYFAERPMAQITTVDGRILREGPEFPGSTWAQHSFQLDAAQQAVMVPETTCVVARSYIIDDTFAFTRLIQPVLAIFKINMINDGVAAVSYDWESDSHVAFRWSDPDDNEVLGRTFAVAPERINLVINENGPDARIEVWQAPVTRLPVLWIALGSFACVAATRLLLQYGGRSSATSDRATRRQGPDNETNPKM